MATLFGSSSSIILHSKNINNFYARSNTKGTFFLCCLALTYVLLPYNPLIARSFFRSGQIEAWGRGIEKITNSCKEWGKPEPLYRVRPNEVMIGFNAEAQFGEKFGEKFGDNQTKDKIMEIMRRNLKTSAKLIAEEIGVTTRWVEKVIRTLKEAGLSASARRRAGIGLLNNEAGKSPCRRCLSHYLDNRKVGKVMAGKRI
jgi:biotin operon repressor